VKKVVKDTTYAKKHGVLCDCGHPARDHYNTEGYCHHSLHPQAGKCGCTWYWPNVKWLEKQSGKPLTVGNKMAIAMMRLFPYEHKIIHIEETKRSRQIARDVRKYLMKTEEGHKRAVHSKLKFGGKVCPTIQTT